MEFDNLRIHYFSIIGRPVSMVFLTPGMWFRALRETSSFDVAHLHEFRTFQNIVMHYHLRRGHVPYCLQARGSLRRLVSKHQLKRLYDRLFGSKLITDAAKLLALSKEEVSDYRALGGTPQQIEVLPNAVDLAEFKNLPARGKFREREGIGKDTTVLLYIGRLHWIKGLDILVRAFHKARSSRKDITLVVVGPDDGQRSKLQALAQRLSLGKSIRFTGALFGERKVEALVDSDIFVLPSRHEAFPNVLLEAYACSKPVIATEVGEVPSIVVDQKTGLVVPPENSTALSRAILKLVNDNRFAQSLGRSGQALVTRRYAVDAVTDRLERIYESVVA